MRRRWWRLWLWLLFNCDHDIEDNDYYDNKYQYEWKDNYNDENGNDKNRYDEYETYYEDKDKYKINNKKKQFFFKKVFS